MATVTISIDIPGELSGSVRVSGTEQGITAIRNAIQAAQEAVKDHR